MKQTHAQSAISILRQGHFSWVVVATLLCLVSVSLVLSAQTPRAASDRLKVMIVIDERNLGTLPTSEVEALAARLLLKENVSVVDQDLVRASMQKDQHMLKMAGDNRGAAALGTRFGADVVVVGEAVAKPSARRISRSNLRTYQAVVTLRAVQTDRAMTLASLSEDASVIGLDDASGGSEALEAAGMANLEILIPEMLAAWRGRDGGAAGTRQIEIIIGGVDQIWKLKAIRKMLNSREDLVRDVIQESYTSGAAVFEATSKIASENLTEQFTLRPPEGLQFQVLNVGKTKINMRAVVRQK